MIVNSRRPWHCMICRKRPHTILVQGGGLVCGHCALDIPVELQDLDEKEKESREDTERLAQHMAGVQERMTELEAEQHGHPAAAGSAAAEQHGHPGISCSGSGELDI